MLTASELWLFRLMGDRGQALLDADCLLIVVEEGSELRIASTPLRQVTMTRKIQAAIVSGSQPPSAIFNRLALKKPASMRTNMPPTPRATSNGQRQTLRMAV